MSNLRNIPVLSSEGGLSRYLDQIRRIPMLDAKEEFMLAKQWRDQGDVEAAHRLVTSHLRLVAKIAMGYRGYGLPLAELIAEGNIGMMQAVKKFDPDRGFRLATYAMWWIRASMQEYILRSWSLVKLGTTAAQKRLFFNLRKLKNQMHAINQGDLSPEQVQAIAKKLDVSESEVTHMNRRLAGADHSLNAPLNSEEGSGEWQDWLVDETSSQEENLSDRQEEDARHNMLQQAMGVLNEREREIIFLRRLQEQPLTLDDLSQKFGVSRERVRQIEEKAFEKLQKRMKLLADHGGRTLLLHGPKGASNQDN